MERLTNPWRGRGLPADAGLAAGQVRSDPTAVLALLARCPVAATTPVHDAETLARRFGVAHVWLKDERARMGLGSFKALGATHAIARMAADRLDRPGAPATPEQLAHALEDTVIACASAGNHGLSVAAGARVFGARAVVYLATSVPGSFAERLRDRGATVERAGADYEASMAAVARDAEANGWVLLSDSSWPGYTELPTSVMEGYLVMGAELADTLPEPPTHVLLQAGVGGLAAAMSAWLRDQWGDDPRIVVVEPTAAPALLDSIRAGRPVTAVGPVSTMGRLDCKDPSHLALAELAGSADDFVTVSDDEVDDTVTMLAEHGFPTTPSGAAGVAALHHAAAHGHDLGLDAHSRVLAILTEGPEESSVRPGATVRTDPHTRPATG